MDGIELIKSNLCCIPLLFDVVFFFRLYCKKQSGKADKIIVDLIMIIFLFHSFIYSWEFIQCNFFSNESSSFQGEIIHINETNNTSSYVNWTHETFNNLSIFDNIHVVKHLQITYVMFFSIRSINFVFEIFYSYEYLNLIVNPLGHGTKRLYFYIVFTSILLAIVFVKEILTIDSNEPITDYFLLINIILVAVFLLFGIYILILLFRSIQVEKFETKKGIQRILSTHLIYMICYIVFSILDIIKHLYTNDSHILVIIKDDILEILIGVLRLSELKIWSFNCRCCTKGQQFHNQSYSTLLEKSKEDISEMQEMNNNANSYIRLSTQTIQPLLNEVIINQDPNQTFSDYFLKSLLSESFQHILQGLKRKTTINPKIKSINDNEYIKVIKNIYASKSFSIESSDEITLNTAGLSNAFSVFSNKKMFLEYAPNVFSNLRIMSEIKESQWKESFDVIKNKDSISKIAGSEGKSSSLFFFTHDNKYIIKTIPERELKTFLKGFLKSYYEHNIENTNTLLVKIYGLFTFKSGLTKINLMVMENIAPFKTNQILYKFDLKGSLVGRETQNLLQNIQIKSLKDQDFLDLKEHSGELINPKKGDIAVIPEIIKGDTKTLADSNLMDYSLFIAIVEKERLKENDKEHEEESLYDSYKKIESENGKYYYYFGIIDYLTEFNFRKTLENSFKNLFVSQSDKDKFSAIKPGPYQVRFFDFLRTHVFVKERDKRGKLIHKKLKW